MNIRVCIVEDDRPLRAIFVDWLKQSRGIQFVKEYPNAEEAIQDMPANSPDVVLMDIHLPGVDGIECVRRLKVKLPDTLFIMFTVYEDDNRIFDALAAGACGYLLKQTSKTALLRAIRDAVDGGSPMSSSIARRVVHSFQCQKPNQAEKKASDALSPREAEILRLLAGGYLYKEIADELGVAEPTVNSFIRRIYDKLQVHSRSQAIAEYFRTV